MATFVIGLYGFPPVNFASVARGWRISAGLTLRSPRPSVRFEYGISHVSADKSTLGRLPLLSDSSLEGYLSPNQQRF